MIPSIIAMWFAFGYVGARIAKSILIKEFPNLPVDSFDRILLALIFLSGPAGFLGVLLGEWLWQKKDS